VPDGVSSKAAIEVPLMAMTGWQMLTRVAPLPPGSVILVVGASGAVGRAMVRLARYLGLTVIGTCSPHNMAQVESLGAIAIDHGRPDLLETIRGAARGQGVAAAFDAIGIGSWKTSWNALAAGGKLIGYGFLGYLESDLPTEEAMRVMTLFHQTWNADGQSDGTGRSTTFYDIRVRRGTHPGEYREDAIELLDLIAKGTLLPDDARELPLADAAEAHRLVAKGGLRERLVLRP
jgi:NADPH:quinone reductase-like Zn-dependent oxidoreductase